MWRYRIWSLASWWLVKCSTVCHCESLAPPLRRCTTPNWGDFTTSYRTSKSESSALDVNVKLAVVMWAAVRWVSISPVLFTRRSCRGKADMRRKAAGLVSIPSETCHKTKSSGNNLWHILPFRYFSTYKASINNIYLWFIYWCCRYLRLYNVKSPKF